MVGNVLVTVVMSGVLSHLIARLKYVGPRLLRILVCLEMNPS